MSPKVGLLLDALFQHSRGNCCLFPHMTRVSSVHVTFRTVPFCSMEPSTHVCIARNRSELSDAEWMGLWGPSHDVTCSITTAYIEACTSDSVKSCIEVMAVSNFKYQSAVKHKMSFCLDRYLPGSVPSRFALRVQGRSLKY